MWNNFHLLKKNKKRPCCVCVCRQLQRTREGRFFYFILNFSSRCENRKSFSLLSFNRFFFLVLFTGFSCLLPFAASFSDIIWRHFTFFIVFWLIKVWGRIFFCSRPHTSFLSFCRFLLLVFTCLLVA